MRRNLEQKIKNLFEKFPVVYLTGPRQSGKTTISQMVFPDIPYVNLEDPSLREIIKEDPHGFLKQYENGIILDEAQNIPELFSYLQIYVDKKNKPAQYLLTGSQNFLLNEKISQTLAGRVGVLNLLPLTFDEIIKDCASTTVDDVIFKGGYPRLYEHNISPLDFFPGYLQTYIERDVRQIKNISSLSKFQKFLMLCAGRVGQIVNFSSLSNDIGLSVPTMKEWLSVLEASYVIHLVQPFSLNVNKQMIKSPKIYFCDTGVLCYLLNIKSINDLKLHFAYGNIFENFVINEFLKAQYNRGEKKNIYFLRDQRNHEVDCLIAESSGNLLYEIKSSATFNKDFVKNIVYYGELDSKTKGFVIYNGEQNFKFKGINVNSFMGMKF